MFICRKSTIVVFYGIYIKIKLSLEISYYSFKSWIPSPQNLVGNVSFLC